jgi:hypothetical protein
LSYQQRLPGQATRIWTRPKNSDDFGAYQMVGGCSW